MSDEWVFTLSYHIEDTIQRQSRGGKGQQMFALTVQMWEDVFGDRGSLDHISPGKATGCCEHGCVVHKLLMEEPPLIAEVRP